MTADRKLIAAGAALGALSVIAGAFGAHSLKNLLPTDQMQVYDTAVKYQVYHSIALVGAGLLYKNYNNRNFIRGGVCFVIGIALFSGSLYILSTSSLYNLQANWIGIITPLGGLLMITGWLLLLIGILRTSP